MINLGTPKKWPLLTGGRCSEVIYVSKWDLKMMVVIYGDRSSEVVVSSGLTVLVFPSSFDFMEVGGLIRLCPGQKL
jgi:hypothetical protein